MAGKDPRDDQATRPEGEQPEQGRQGLDRARRTLLKVGLYTAPAIVSTLVISADAAAQVPVPSCTPNLCEPNATCGPGVPPCGPNRCDPFEDCGPFTCGPYCAPDGAP